MAKMARWQEKTYSVQRDGNYKLRGTFVLIYVSSTTTDFVWQPAQW